MPRVLFGILSVLPARSFQRNSSDGGGDRLRRGGWLSRPVPAPGRWSSSWSRFQFWFWRSSPRVRGISSFYGERSDWLAVFASWHQCQRLSFAQFSRCMTGILLVRRGRGASRKQIIRPEQANGVVYCTLSTLLGEFKSRFISHFRYSTSFSPVANLFVQNGE